jgi:hypothetical protein
MNLIGCLDRPTEGAATSSPATTSRPLDADARAVRAQPAHRLRLPGLQPPRAHERAGERRAPADLPRRPRASGARGHPRAGAGGPRRPSSRTPRAALGRPAAARRHRAGAGHRARGAPRRRAHGQPRLAHHRGRARADAVAAPRAGAHHRDGHPRARRRRVRDAPGHRARRAHRLRRAHGLPAQPPPPARGSPGRKTATRPRPRPWRSTVVSLAITVAHGAAPRAALPRCGTSSARPLTDARHPHRRRRGGGDDRARRGRQEQHEPRSSPPSGSTSCGVCPGASGERRRAGRGGQPLTLTDDDGEAIAREIPRWGRGPVLTVASVQVVVGARNVATRVTGTTPGYFDVRAWPASRRRALGGRGRHAHVGRVLHHRRDRAARSSATKTRWAERSASGGMPCTVVACSRPRDRGASGRTTTTPW